MDRTTELLADSLFRERTAPETRDRRGVARMLGAALDCCRPSRFARLLADLERPAGWLARTR